ncbi:hypothetical protein EIP91_006970 [Steccherinum ochraceum]|uniref:Uncharacterized protein n=1 Tax=Steccherinum ochraceum TaxID=92696 RepID=A0A4R0R4U5_9APHY|nr:hypothetical protein EIP91_006970 [Steccherinum ochraceum]
MTNLRLLAFFVFSILIGILSVPYSSWKDIARRVNLWRTPLSWLPAPRDQVVLRFIHSSVHYNFGAVGWDHLLPAHEDAHLVRTQDADGTLSTKTVALFHQLSCVDILHQAYVEEGSHQTSELVQHCLNYIRQAVMCQLDMSNEPQGDAQTSNGRDSLCHDWESVYREAERNWDAYGKVAMLL